MSLALYRKYRPQSFKEIVGQEYVVQTVSNAIRMGMISHAYLFAGPRGSGKTTIARLLSKSINCRNRKEGEFEPCNKCSSCLEIGEGRSLDLIEIDAASHRGIDEIRELREGIKFAPVKEKFKVFLLDEAHQLTKEAVNALLKILEEPPSHAVFIMATTEAHKMLPTIISRCQRFDFRKLNFAEIISRLEYICSKEKAKIEKPALELIAINSGGAIRDAESLLDQALAFSGENSKIILKDDIKNLLGMADSAMISKFAGLLAEKKSEGAINYLNEIFESGCDPQEFAKALVGYFRKAMLIKINPDNSNPLLLGLTKEEQESLKAQTASFTSQDLRKFIGVFIDAESRIKYSPIPQLPLEIAILDLTVKES